MMIYQNILHATASFGIIICILISLQLPWARPRLPIVNGFYEVNVPIEIGLTKCYSDICKEYGRYNQILSPQNENNDNDNTPDTDWKIKQPHVPYPTQLKKNYFKKFIAPFQYAAYFTLTLLSLSCVLSLCLILLLVHESVFFIRWTSVYFRHVMLSIALFVLFLGVVGYLAITCGYMNGGRYEDGVWICSYCCLIGLFCSFLSALAVDNTNAHLYHSISDHSHPVILNPIENSLYYQYYMPTMQQIVNDVNEEAMEMMEQPTNHQNGHGSPYSLQYHQHNQQYQP